LAGTATGVYDSLEEAVNQTAVPDKTYSPDSRRAGIYAKKFEVYRDLYPTLSPLNRRLYNPPR
jgi:sugar (pentulose or hexulose) kinase